MYKISKFITNSNELTKFMTDNTINPFIFEYNVHL